MQPSPQLFFWTWVEWNLCPTSLNFWAKIFLWHTLLCSAHVLRIISINTEEEKNVKGKKNKENLQFASSFQENSSSFTTLSHFCKCSIFHFLVEIYSRESGFWLGLTFPLNFLLFCFVFMLTAQYDVVPHWYYFLALLRCFAVVPLFRLCPVFHNSVFRCSWFCCCYYYYYYYYYY